SDTDGHMSRQSAGLSREERGGVLTSGFDADTIEEFAVKNRISRSQVYKEIDAGRLIASKVQSRTIITRENGAAWRRALPTPKPPTPPRTTSAPPQNPRPPLRGFFRGSEPQSSILGGVLVALRQAVEGMAASG